METVTDTQMKHLLYHDDKEIILLGTAHVSKESAQLVTQVITEEKPDTVCVELCQARYQSIRQKDRWLEMDMRYVREQSFLTDLRILFLTVPAVLSRRGAH